MSSDDRWVKALSEVHDEPAPSGPMDKARTIEALHAAFTELQISICSVSKVEHEMTIRLALLAMGYQEEVPGTWIKPVGYQLFSYREKTDEWTCWFKGADGDIHAYERHAFEHDVAHHGPYLRQLKNLECFTRTDMYIDANSEFEMRAIDV